MAQRKRIGLIFEVTPSWMGGTYYVLNIINALNTLPDAEKPEIILIVKKKEDFNFAKDQSTYPYLKISILKTKIPFLIRAINKVSRIVFKNNIFNTIPKFREDVDAVYPLQFPTQLNTKQKKIFWKPDFQEKFLPHLFSDDLLLSRDKTVKQVLSTKDILVLSSDDAKNALEKFYPESISTDKRIYKFTVTIPDTSNLVKEEIFKKFGIDRPFFYCANQFWIHKNHRVLFEAFKKIKSKIPEILLICSGGTSDFRNPNYFSELQDYIKKEELEENIKILGLIDRQEQLCLIQNCEAIIQPSLFEGWSTSVEEAKAMNKFLILSDLPLHKEQAPLNSIFFERNNPDDLAEKIEWFISVKPEIIPIDYNKNIQEAARNFLSIMFE